MMARTYTACPVAQPTVGSRLSACRIGAYYFIKSPCTRFARQCGYLNRYRGICHASSTDHNRSHNPNTTTALQASRQEIANQPRQLQQSQHQSPVQGNTQTHDANQTINNTGQPAQTNQNTTAEDEYETVYETEYTEESMSDAQAEDNITKSATANNIVPVATPQAQLTTVQGSNNIKVLAGEPANQQAVRGITTSAGQQSQTLAVASMVSAQQTLSQNMQTSVSGWVVAACMLLAARFSREEADTERLDLQALQARQSESRVQSVELRAKRRAFLEQERIRKEQEAAKRLEEARKKAEEEAVAKAAREAAYREAAAKETARLWAEQQAARADFIAQEARMKEELARRTALELKLRQEEAAKKRQEEEQARIAAELEREREAAAAARRAEEERLKREAEEAARREASLQRRAAQTWYCIKLDGTATVQTAAPGTLTTESQQPGWQRGPQIARLNLSLKMGLGPAAVSPAVGQAGSAQKGQTASVNTDITTPSHGIKDEEAVDSQRMKVDWVFPDVEGTSAQAAYESAAAALDGNAVLCSQVSQPLLHSIWQHLSTPPDAAVQHVAAPDQVMDELELTHWRRVSAACCEVASRQAIAQVAPLADRQSLDQPFQVTLKRAVLPSTHDDNIYRCMQEAVHAFKQEDLEAVVRVISRLVELEVECLTSHVGTAVLGSPAGQPAAALPPLTLIALLYAYFLDSVTHEIKDTLTIDFTDDSSQRALQLATHQLQQAAKRQPADALTPTAACLQVALGAGHPMTKLMMRLAEDNMSTASRLKAEARKQQAELEVAAALLKAQDPVAARGLDPNDPAARQALTPIPERLWAVRNVAGSMVRFGDPSQAAEAINMLLDACELAVSHYGAKHPSCAGLLLDTRDALQVALAKCDDDDKREGLQESFDDVTRSLIDIVEALADRFLQSNDTASVVVLYESAVKELGPVGSRTSSKLGALQKEAESLMYQLSPIDARKVIAKRKASTSVLRAVAKEMTEELKVYSTGSRRITRLEQWQKGLPLTSLLV